MKKEPLIMQSLINSVESNKQQSQLSTISTSIDVKQVKQGEGLIIEDRIHRFILDVETIEKVL